MAIIGTLPNIINNGDAVDASPVMADFNFIVNQVNANGVANGTLPAPTGTNVAFQQAAAPVGWVARTDAIATDAFMRMTTPSTYLGSSGVNAASGLMLGTAAITDFHALTVAELAQHTHTFVDPGHVHPIIDPGHNHAPAAGGSFVTLGAAGGATFAGGPNGGAAGIATALTNIGMGTVVTGASILNAGSNNGHTHNLTNFNYKFIDFIVCSKS